MVPLVTPLKESCLRGRNMMYFFVSLNPLTSHVIKKNPPKNFLRGLERVVRIKITTAALKSFPCDHFEQEF